MQRFNKDLLFFYEATFKKKTTSSLYYIPYWEYVKYIALCALVVPSVPSIKSNKAADTLYGDTNSFPFFSTSP
jgi:hypothetical protein